MDVFFTHLENKVALLEKDWFLAHMSVMSSFTLNAFLAFASTQPLGPQVAHSRGDVFYENAHRDLPQALAHPTIYVCLGLGWMSGYAIACGKNDFMVYTTICHRMAEGLGLFDETNSVGSHSLIESEIRRRMAILYYEIDRYSAYMSGLPVFREELPLIELPLGHFFAKEATDESLLALQLSAARLKLMHLFGRVIQWNNHRGAPIISQSQFVSDSVKLDEDLTSWFADLSPQLNKKYDSYTARFTANSASWDLCYVHCLAHFCRLSLHRSRFEVSLQVADHHHPSYVLCITSALAIGEYIQLFLKHDPMFSSVIQFISNIMFESACVLASVYEHDPNYPRIIPTYLMQLKQGLLNVSYSWFYTGILHERLTERLLPLDLTRNTL